jgi:Uma2 family endonuclease
LHTQGQVRGLGEAYVETGVVLWRSPDRVVGPDASFICAKSLPARESAEGFLETIPELVVEVRSKNDVPSEVDRKVADYLKSGVRVVWIVEPEAAVVVEYQSGQLRRVFGTADILTCEDLIPGFQLPLAELFR